MPNSSSSGGPAQPPGTGPSSIKPLVLNELMASNTVTLMNPQLQGDHPDWFEIYNPNTIAINLAGMYVTDDLSNFKKYRIPGNSSLTNIPPKSYIVLYADDTVSLGPLHVAFKLSATGEQLGLADTSGNPIDSVRFGAQTSDISFGRLPDGTGAFQITTSATPGTRNQ
ncbi:MAG: lamin tail domain-containing protein [Bacteroidota bacterium]